MKQFVWSELTDEEKYSLTVRPTRALGLTIGSTVKEIFKSVKNDGDAALVSLREKFDGIVDSKIILDVKDVIKTTPQLEPPEKAAIKKALSNITNYHRAIKPLDVSLQISPGVYSQLVWRPLERIGLYIPGGSAPLVSTLLMLLVPARLAGVEDIIVMTPPRGKSLVDPAIAYVADLCGISNIYAIGGASAIAAMTYGTKTVPKVDKVFGPGNAYVNEAKKYARGLPEGPAIDLPAGPSEVLVIADGTANPKFVALDLLAQAEHDPLAQVVLVSTSQDLGKAVLAEIKVKKQTLSRLEIIDQALENALMILVDDLSIAMDVANLYGPEHLIINTENPDSLVPEIKHAGAVFLGPWSPEAAGDYATGTNHVLPTGRAVRAYSGLSTTSFMKSISVQKLSQKGLLELGPTIEKLADLEGLDGHRSSISVRLDEIKNGGSGV
ncbi:MAG: histidinol dehydrogenase [Sphingomonadales bacterium]